MERERQDILVVEIYRCRNRMQGSQKTVETTAMVRKGCIELTAGQLKWITETLRRHAS